MNRSELQYLEKLLERVKDSDGKVAKALALVRKDIAAYEARKGQLRESYEVDISGWGQ